MTLDPTQTLTEIRELAEEWPEIDDFDALPQKVKDLDEWLSKGGFLPDQWNNMGRPRLKGDGDVVLEGVEHGKPSTYSRGCRCEECRDANRKKAARWRAGHRQNQES